MNLSQTTGSTNNTSGQSCTSRTIPAALGDLFSILPVCVWVAGLVMAGALLWLCAATRPPREERIADIASRAEKSTESYVHVTARARLAPGDSFGPVSPQAQFQPVTFLRTEKPSCRWAINTGNDAFVAAGRLQYKITDAKVTQQSPAGCHPQIGFLGHFLWGALMHDIEEHRIDQHGLSARRHTVLGRDGKAKLHLSIGITSQHRLTPSSEADRMQAGWFDLGNAKEYVIDIETGRLEKAEVYMMSGHERVVVFQTTSISYGSSEFMPQIPQ
jgi:ribosomal protein L16/L10AE